MPDETTSGQGDQAVQEAGQVHRIRAETIPVFYANNVSLQTSIWDIALDFGSVVSHEGGILTVRDELRVIMSPQHAKVFAEVLAKNVRAYEEQFGRLPTAPTPNQDESPVSADQVYTS